MRRNYFRITTALCHLTAVLCSVASGAHRGRADADAWPHTSLRWPRAPVLVRAISSRRQTGTPGHTQTRLEDRRTEGRLTRSLQALHTVAR